MNKDIKRIALLSALLIILVLFLTIFDKPEKKEKDKKEKEAKALFIFDLKDINKIEIDEKNKKVIILKNNDKWKITKPIAYEANEMEINAYLNRFLRLKSSLALKNKKIDQFGFNKDNDTYTLYSNKEYKIIKGDAAPDALSFYAMTNLNQDIVLLRKEDFEENGLSPKLKSLRNKDFLKITDKSLKSIMLNGLQLYKTEKSSSMLKALPEGVNLNSINNASYDAVKKQIIFNGAMTEEDKKKLKALSDNKDYSKAIDKLFEESHKKKWVFSVNANEEVDLTATDILISDILNIKAVDFIDNKKEQSKIKGETINLTIESSDKKQELTLIKTKDKLYAKLKGNSILFEVGNYLYESLSKKKADLLVKKDEKEISPESLKVK